MTEDIRDIVARAIELEAAAANGDQVAAIELEALEAALIARGDQDRAEQVESQSWRLSEELERGIDPIEVKIFELAEAAMAGIEAFVSEGWTWGEEDEDPVAARRWCLEAIVSQLQQGRPAGQT